MAATLPRGFFDRPVDKVAKELIGVTLLVNGAGGLIVETESYDHEDPASHSFGMRRSARNASMFGPPGIAYVYRIYGMYWCLNFVCRPGSAVLIRALEPQMGLAAMTRRRGTDKAALLCAGPGRLCQALAIDNGLDGASLYKPPFKLIGASEKAKLHRGTRIGITKGAELHRRFGLYGSAFLSRRFADEN